MFRVNSLFHQMYVFIVRRGTTYICTQTKSIDYFVLTLIKISINKNKQSIDKSLQSSFSLVRNYELAKYACALHKLSTVVSFSQIKKLARRNNPESDGAASCRVSNRQRSLKKTKDGKCKLFFIFVWLIFFYLPRGPFIQSGNILQDHLFTVRLP